MSEYINDIDDQEFIEMVREIELKRSFFDKLYFSMDKTGIQCLLPEDFVTRTIKGAEYFWGFAINHEHEYDYILNILCDHHHNLYYKFLGETLFKKKVNSNSGVLIPGIIEYELKNAHS